MLVVYRNLSRSGTSIIESAVARVSGVKNIEASSEENNTRIPVEFQPEIDLNDAANDVS
ncbi:MAG: hypothetical protein ACOH5I_21395 [Oligoflexus sp.]